MRTKAAVLGVGILVVALSGCANGSNAPAPSMTPMSDGEAHSLYEESLNDYSSHLEEIFPGVSLPELSVVRYIEPHEYGPVMSECLGGLGFEATPQADGGIAFGYIPDEQAQAQSVAIYTCMAQYPVHPKYRQPLTSEQNAYLYEYVRDSLIPCLESKGVDVPELPSLQEWEQRRAPGGPGWDAFSNASAGRSFDKYQSLYVSCPMYPDRLWG